MTGEQYEAVERATDQDMFGFIIDFLDKKQQEEARAFNAARTQEEKIVNESHYWESVALSKMIDFLKDQKEQWG